jgi:hypothetical protein
MGKLDKRFANVNMTPVYNERHVFMRYFKRFIGARRRYGRFA